MQSKADTSQLNLRTAPATKKVDRQKILKVKKRMCSEVSVNSPGNPWMSVREKKRKAAVGRICRKKRRF